MLNVDGMDRPSSRSVLLMPVRNQLNQRHLDVQEISLYPQEKVSELAHRLKDWLEFRGIYLIDAHIRPIR